MNADELAQIAQQLVARVRDDDADANGRWLGLMCPDPADWWRLVFVLAAAVPDDRTWTELTLWIRGDGGPDTEDAIMLRRAAVEQALRGAPGRRQPLARKAADSTGFVDAGPEVRQDAA